MAESLWRILPTTGSKHDDCNSARNPVEHESGGGWLGIVTVGAPTFLKPYHVQLSPLIDKYPINSRIRGLAPPRPKQPINSATIPPGTKLCHTDYCLERPGSD